MDPGKLSQLTDAIEIFETILGTRKWASGSTFTLADISLCQSFCQLDAFDYNIQQFPRVTAWYKATQQQLKPYGYEVRVKKCLSVNVRKVMKNVLNHTGNQSQSDVTMEGDAESKNEQGIQWGYAKVAG